MTELTYDLALISNESQRSKITEKGNWAVRNGMIALVAQSSLLVQVASFEFFNQERTDSRIVKAWMLRLVPSAVLLL